MSIHPPSSWKTQLKQWVAVEQAHQHEDKLFLVLTLAIGAVVGLVVAAFILLTENLGSRMYPPGGAAWRRLAVPIAGSLATGFLLYRYFPGARGSGIPQTKTALFLEDGVILFRTVLGRFGVSSLSLASGIALGREGPSVQVGAGIASVLGRWLGLGPSKVKALIPIGASAALAAAFNTPVAAVLFTLEEVMGDLHAPVLGSIVLSSATSWIVLHLVLGDEPLFHVPSYQLVHPLEFLGYALLGTVGGLVSVLFVKLLLWIRKFFLVLPKWTVWFQPVAGGLLVGVLALFFPDVLGVGYSHVSQALNSQLTLTAMALLVALKIVATATCYSSGNAGGIFGPSLFIGAMMGGALGSGAHSLFPDYTGSTGAYALVGMGAAFAGIVRVPLTSVIMIFEMTRDYTIIVPLMISNLISYYISQRFQREPIYEALQHQEGIHLPPSKRHREGVMLVKEAARSVIAPLVPTDTLGEALSRMDPECNACPVVQNDVFIGMVTLDKVQDAAARDDTQTLGTLVPLLNTQSPLHSGNFPHVFPDDSLDTALRRMADAEVNVLPVVSRANVRRLAGIVSLRSIMDAYGLGAKRSRLEGPPARATGAPRGLFIGVLASVLGLFIVIGFLNSHYRSVRQGRAQNHYQLGNELIRQGRPSEAVEEYRSALSISRENSEYRVALGMALVEADNPLEAEVYLLPVLKMHPDNGRANLGMGRIDAHEGHTKEAEDYYHRAIYGVWPTNAMEERLRTRFELVNYLEKVGANTQAVSELLAIPEQAPKDTEARRSVGQHLLKLGSAAEASEVFRGILRDDDRDAQAYTGLGQAQLALSRYRQAVDAFRNALKWDPENPKAKSQSQIAEEVLAIDPAMRGLSTGERYQRSVRLIELTSGSLERCNPIPAQGQTLLETARQAVQSSRRRPPAADAVEKNVSLAEQIFSLDKQLCGKLPHDEALARVLAVPSRN